jgi:hypothetical protein
MGLAALDWEGGKNKNPCPMIRMFAKYRCSLRRIALGLMLLLVLAPISAVAHELDHALNGADSQCELCLAGSSLGHGALTADSPDFYFGSDLSPFVRLSQAIHACPAILHHARAPPA